MGIVIFFVLALLSAAAIAYPLLPGQRARPTALAITDGEIDSAVRQIRLGQSAALVLGADQCPACGHGYQPGDQFCVRCGSPLPQPVASKATSPGFTCPNCSVALHEEDLFCAKCGHRMEQAASPEPTGSGEDA